MERAQLELRELQGVLCVVPRQGLGRGPAARPRASSSHVSRRHTSRGPRGPGGPRRPGPPWAWTRPSQSVSSLHVQRLQAPALPLAPLQDSIILSSSFIRLRTHERDMHGHM